MAGPKPPPKHERDPAPAKKSAGQDEASGPPGRDAAPGKKTLPPLGGAGDLSAALGTAPAAPSLAEELARKHGADLSMAQALEASDPSALTKVREALEQQGASTQGLADALLGLYLDAAPASVGTNLGASPWFALLAAPAWDDLKADPTLLARLAEVDRGGVASQSPTAGVVAQVLTLAGLAGVAELRTVATEGLAADGKLDETSLLEVDRLLLSGEAAGHLSAVTALAQEITAEAQTFQAEVEAVEGELSVPPTMAEMDRFKETLTAFEPRLATWKQQLLAFEKPALGWVLRAAHEAQGEPDFDELLQNLRTSFQQAIGGYFGATDDYNTTEIERENELAQTPESKGGLRAQGPAAAGKDEAEPALGDKDWVPMHIPGLKVKRHPLPKGTVSQASARGAGDITAAVVHTGGRTAEGTVGTLSGNKTDAGKAQPLEGHYAVDPDGASLQMHPASQAGVHASSANKQSIAIDLATGARGDESALIGFLESGKQLIATAKLLEAHARVSPEIRAGGAHDRGEVFGAQLGEIDKLTGAYAGVASYGSKRGKAAADLKGVYAHQSLPDGTHGDPGGAYMQRLQAMQTLLAEYEKQYGPIQLEDDKEVERVLRVFERYREATGHGATPIDEAELEARVEAAVAKLPKAKRGSDEEREKIVRRVFNKMMAELAEEHYGEAYKAELAKVKAEVDANLTASDVVFAGSLPEKSFFEETLGKRPGKDDPTRAGWEAKAKRLVGKPAYAKAEQKFAERALSSLAKDILIGRAYKSELESRVGEFRLYLQQHLSDLLQ